MSVRLMGSIWYSALETLPKILLLALADHADDEGYHCRPSVERLGIKTGLARRTVQKYLAEFREAGILTIVSDATRYSPTDYRINADRVPIPKEQGRTRCTPDSTRGAADDTSGARLTTLQGRIAVAPKPSLEPSLEPNPSPSEGGEVQNAPPLPKTETSKNGKKPKPVDPRHAAFQELVMETHQKQTREDCPWDGAEANQLARLLRRSKQLNEFGLKNWLVNYWQSKNINPADPPCVYLLRLEKYRNSPLDQYGKPLRGTGTLPPQATSETTAGETLRRQLAEEERRRAARR